VECDLRRPCVAEALGLHRGPGLADALVSGPEGVADAIQHIDLEGRTNGRAAGQRLDVLVAGAMPPNPAQLIESHAMEAVLRWAASHYDLVVVDTPPISAVPDAIPLMKHVDGVIAVSRLRQSTRDASEHFRRRLERLGAPMVGVVANDLRGRAAEPYGYGYEYESSAPSAPPAELTAAGTER
jgi:receptor protein-tyrosine kinase